MIEKLKAPFRNEENPQVDEGVYLKASAIYTEAIKSNPYNAVSYSNRSLAYLKLCQPLQALKDAEIAVYLMPKWAKGYYRKAKAEEGLHAYDQAISSYEKGLSMCPDDEVLRSSLQKVIKKKYMYEKHVRFHKRLGAFFLACVAVFSVYIDANRSNGTAFISRPQYRWFVVTIAMLLGYFSIHAYYHYKIRYIRDVTILNSPVPIPFTDEDKILEDYSD